MTGGEHCVKMSGPGSNGLGFMVFFEDLEEKDCSLNQSVNYGGVCRTAPATPSLLTRHKGHQKTMENAFIFIFQIGYSLKLNLSPTQPQLHGQTSLYPGFILAPVHVQGEAGRQSVEYACTLPV